MRGVRPLFLMMALLLPACTPVNTLIQDLYNAGCDIQTYKHSERSKTTEVTCSDQNATH